MATQTALSLMKQGLLIGTDGYDTYLSHLLDAAKAYLIREGASSLDETETGDLQLIVGYADYLYRQRSDASYQMPRWLRWNINNRIFSEKMTEEEDGE